VSGGLLRRCGDSSRRFGPAHYGVLDVQFTERTVKPERLVLGDQKVKLSMRYIAWFGLFLVFIVIGVALREQRGDRLMSDGQDNDLSLTRERASLSGDPGRRLNAFPIESEVVLNAEALISLRPGQFFSLAKESSGAQRFQIRVTESQKRSDMTQIKGVVEGGGQFLSTVSENLTQIFLTTPQGNWRFVGQNFSGSLIPSKSVGLENDVLRPSLGEQKISEPSPAPVRAISG